MSSPKFTIHVIGLNRSALTKACIASVQANSDPSQYRLILTNNGSTDDTATFFNSLGDAGKATVFHNKTNEGFIAPNNRAFETAKELGATYYIALNNDTEVPPNWLNKLAEPLDKDPYGALSGPEGSCHSLHPDMGGYPGDKLEYIEGSCLCAKISIVKTQGPLFSTYLDFIYGDDSDLSLRMREAGYNIYEVPFTIKHARCATTHEPAVRERCKQAQAHNHEVGMKRWSFYLRHRHFNYPVIVKRRYSIGDVILTTPIIEALRKQEPNRAVWVETDFPDVFTNNPHVEKAWQKIPPDVSTKTINLDDAYENKINTSILDGYWQEAKSVFPGLLREDDCPRLYPSETDYQWATNLAKNNQFSPKVAILHSYATDWIGKRWPVERYAEVALWLVKSGWHVVAVGNNPLSPGFPAFDLIGKTSILQLAALLDKSNLFIGPDSFPLHAALCMGCPTVGIFGTTNSKYIRHTPETPQIMLDAPSSVPCAGSRHREMGKNRVDCSPDCVNATTVEQVKFAVRNLGVL